MTYNYSLWHKEDCSACTGSCRTEDALTTDTMYDESESGIMPGVSLALGYYDGETLVVAA